MKKEAVYQQKIADWKRSTQDKANDAKAAEEADDKKFEEKVVRIKAARKKAVLKEDRNKDLLEKGPLETEEGCPPDQDLGTRATTEPIKEPPHDHNNNL